MSLADHERHVLSLIRKWCEKNKEKLNLESFELEAGVDFILNIGFDGNSIISGSIKCKCEKSVSLARNENKLQTSNYYKHLQSASCTLMKAVRNSMNESREESQQRTTTPALTSSRTRIPWRRTSDDEPMSMQNSSHQFPVTSSKSVHQRKRRVESQSRQQSSAKRSRKWTITSLFNSFYILFLSFIVLQLILCFWVNAARGD